MAPFYGQGSTASRLQPFYRPRKDERLSRPWSHPELVLSGISVKLSHTPIIFKIFLNVNKFGLTFPKNKLSYFLKTLSQFHQNVDPSGITTTWPRPTLNFRSNSYIAELKLKYYLTSSDHLLITKFLCKQMLLHANK